MIQYTSKYFLAKQHDPPLFRASKGKVVDKKTDLSMSRRAKQSRGRQAAVTPAHQSGRQMALR
jgi:hypothetical protein